MNAYYLRAQSQAAMNLALSAAGIADGQDGVRVIVIGEIPVNEDGVGDPSADLGWHVNVYGKLSPEQLALLPLIDEPGTPTIALQPEPSGIQVYGYDILTGYATGAVMYVRPGAGLPAGWSAQTLPTLIDGEYALWRSGRWVVTTDPPHPPAVPVPQSVSRAQGKAALISAGLWPDVLSYVAGIEDAKHQALAEVALHDTQDWRRDSPFLAQAAAALSLTDEQLDDLFRQAKEVAL